MKTLNLPTFFRGGPYRNLLNLHRQMDQWFDDVVSSGNIDPGLMLMEDKFIPMCDFNETESHYLMSAELPGVRKEDIKITFEDGMITIVGVRHEDREATKHSYGISERFYGSFERSFRLPMPIKKDQIEASFESGVLRLTIPKAVSEKSGEHIKITEGKPRFWDRLIGHGTEKTSTRPEKVA